MEQNVWIEARLSKNGDLGEEIGSGRYIVNKNNIRTNKNIIMNEIKVDDYIIHIRMEGRLKEICGISIVDEILHSEDKYACSLKNYIKFYKAIHIYDDFLNKIEYKDAFLNLLKTKIKGEKNFLLFHKNKNNKFEITQGRYFSRCPLELLELINHQYLNKNPTQKKLPLINDEIKNFDPSLFEKKDELMNVEDVLNDTFFSKEKFLEIIDQLKSKKNIIIQGPPGVGKTFIAKKIADYFCNRDQTKQSRLVFHENYSNILSRYKDSKSFNANNLYQITSYITNMKNQEGKNVNLEGILLYAQNSNDIILDEKYNWMDHKVTIKTINLNKQWKNIEEDLLKLCI